MADLYSVISGIQPDQQDILEAELLAKQILEANFPDLDLREGTALRDLTIRPSAFLLALCKKGYDTYFSQNTLSGATNDTPEEVIDDLMGNLFLDRKTGTYAVINARLFFARQKTVSLTQDTSFSTDGSILFYPLSNAAYPTSAMQYDSYQNEWYIDVDLKAADTGTTYNLNEGSLLYFTNFDPYFLHAEINYLRDSSTAAETNTEFLTRAETAISTRNLINKPSIISNLSSAFNTIPHIYSVGSGDVEMYRDQVKVLIDPPAGSLVNSIYESFGTVYVTALAHNLLSGQRISVNGAVPTGYNGVYTISVVDVDHFTYPASDTLFTATALPTIQPIQTELYVHQAGTVDVYCDDDLRSNVSQFTLDSNGEVIIEGPILNVSRSDISGGTGPDTLPGGQNPIVIPYTSEDFIDPKKFYSINSGLTTGDVVAISGITQSISIASISCLPGQTYATVHAAGHPISSNGTLITVSGVFPTDYNGDFVAYRLDADNFTYQVPNRITLAGSGGAMKVFNRALLTDQYPSGTKFGAVTVTGSYFLVVMPNFWTGIAVAGTAVITKEPPFILSYDGYTTRTDGKFVVNSTSFQQVNMLNMIANPLSIGRYVQISGSSNPLNNQIWKVTGRVDANTVSIEAPVFNNYVAGTGDLTVKFVNPQKDFAFSTKQTLKVHYGPTYAGDTVSLETLEFNNVANVQGYLENENNRVLCGDFLARGFDTYLLDISLTVYNSATPTTGEAQTLINQYLDALAPGSVFVVSELVAILRDGGIPNLRIPITIKATYHQKDMFEFAPFNITDVFDPQNSTAIYVLNSVTTTTSNI